VFFSNSTRCGADRVAQDNGPSSPPSRPDMVHTSSSASHITGISNHSQLAALSLQSSSASNHMIQPFDQRPSLSDARRVSSGIGAGSTFGQGSYRDKEDAVPVGFDEGILRGLCDMDVSVDVLGMKGRTDEAGISKSTGGQDQTRYRFLQGESPDIRLC
jgi:hypothetical protein